jgi:hypothetical protein
MEPQATASAGMAALHDIGRLLTVATDLSKAFTAALNVLRSHVGLENGTVSLLDPVTGDVFLESAPEMDDAERILGRVQHGAQHVLGRDGQENHRQRDEHARPHGRHAAHGVVHVQVVLVTPPLQQDHDHAHRERQAGLQPEQVAGHAARVGARQQGKQARRGQAAQRQHQSGPQAGQQGLDTRHHDSKVFPALPRVEGAQR